MKLIIGLIAIASINTFAAVNTNVDIQIGKGKYICMAEGIDDNPGIARANSQELAKDLALEQCADLEGSDFFCKVKECQSDSNAKNLNVSINFNIDRSGSDININLNNGTAGYRCIKSVFGDRYKATAPTELEAKVLVRKVCMSDGHHGMHCDDVDKCIELENDNSGSISIGNDGIDVKGIIDFFKRF